MGWRSWGARRAPPREDAFEPVEILRSACGDAEAFRDFRTILVTLTSLCWRSGYD